MAISKVGRFAAVPGDVLIPVAEDRLGAHTKEVTRIGILA